MFLFFVLYHLMLCGNFYGSEIRYGIVFSFFLSFFFFGGGGGGVNFGLGVFSGFVWFCLKPKDFLGFNFCPNSIIPAT